MRRANIVLVLFLSHVAAMLVASLAMPELVPDHLAWAARAFSD